MKSFSRGKRGLGASKGSRLNKDSMGRITSTSKNVGHNTYTQSYRGQGSKITQSNGGRTTVFDGAVKPHKFKLTKHKTPNAPTSDNLSKSPMKMPKAYKAPRYSRSSGSGSGAGFFSNFTFINPFRRSKEIDQSFDAHLGSFRESEDYEVKKSRDGFDPFLPMGNYPILEETYQEMVDCLAAQDAETNTQKEPRLSISGALNPHGSCFHNNWYYLQNNVTLGPLSNIDLTQLLAKGTITADTLVWTQGMPEWEAARNTTLIQGLLPKPLSIPGLGVGSTSRVTGSTLKNIIIGFIRGLR